MEPKQGASSKNPWVINIYNSAGAASSNTSVQSTSVKQKNWMGQCVTPVSCCCLVLTIIAVAGTVFLWKCSSASNNTGWCRELNDNTIGRFSTIGVTAVAYVAATALIVRCALRTLCCKH